MLYVILTIWPCNTPFLASVNARSLTHTFTPVIKRQAISLQKQKQKHQNNSNNNNKKHTRTTTRTPITNSKHWGKMSLVNKYIKITTDIKSAQIISHLPVYEVYFIKTTISCLLKAAMKTIPNKLTDPTGIHPGPATTLFYSHSDPDPLPQWSL